MSHSEPQRVGAIVPYRMTSSRLPRKAFAPIAGKPAIERVVERARGCKYVETVVIAMPEEPESDELADFCVARGWPVYRGSAHDVLRRMAEAASAHAFDLVVEVDGDDLLCAEEYMDRGVEILRERDLEALTFTGLPLGVTPKVLRADALSRAVAEKNYDDTETGFFRFLWESGRFRVADIGVSDSRHMLEACRMTLDYPEDAEFFGAVYAHLDALDEPFALSDLLAWLRTRPDVVNINLARNDDFQQYFDAGLAEMNLESGEGS